MGYNPVASLQAMTSTFLTTEFTKQVVSQVTSLTRPPGVLGQMIYETDTGSYATYDGAAWVYLTHVGAWTAYTPGIGSTGTAPALGNGTLTGHYQRISRAYFFTIEFVPGSTTTFGTGSLIFSLPPPGGGTGRYASITGVLEKTISGPGNLYTYQAILPPSTGAVGLLSTFTNPPTYLTSATTPTIANGDRLTISGTFEGLS